MEDDFVGAIKIKDGLFIGDEYAAQDFEFVVTNKVTHIINCAGKQVPNYWETVGVIYLTFDWMDSEHQIVFDAKGEVVNQIFQFIEEAAKLGEGVLVHSVKGQSRSCCVLTAYFMKRYRWSLYKTLEFLTSRRSDLEIRTSFYHQLLNLEARLFQLMEGQLTSNWFETAPEYDHEEALLRNTFLNARSAPFDEALINPQFTTDIKSRKLNWTDEKNVNKAGLFSYLTEKTGLTKSGKAGTSSVKSILKGSNKVFKLKAKNEEEDVATPVAKTQSGTSPGLRVHKSLRNLSETRNTSEALDEEKSPISANVERADKVAQDKTADNKAGSKAANMQRSSSACYFERDEINKSGSTPKPAYASTTDKSPSGTKANSINGNIIHVTVNNYLAPVNNLGSVNVADNSPSTADTIKDQSSKPGSSSHATRAAQKYGLTNEAANGEPISYASTKPSALENTKAPAPEKTGGSTSHLKSQIEKKLSKEYSTQKSNSFVKNDPTPAPIKSNPGDRPMSESKPIKLGKDMSRPNDIKVNYGGALLKNRETPPPRKRDEAKKIPESPQKKALSKSALSSSKAGGSTDSGMPYSSYLNSLFTSSFSHLNTATPSAYVSNYPSDKKTPISTKATPLSYNLTLSQKAQSLTRPQRATPTTQIGEKNYSSSLLGSSLTKSKILSQPIEPSSTTNLNSKYNNYISQTKGNPVRVTYEKIDRPHSATPDRSVTPQAGLKRIGTPSTSIGFTNKSDQRLSAPSKNNKHTKKDSGSTHELLAKYRQRSPSPSQAGYSPVLSNSMNLKPSKSKY